MTNENNTPVHITEVSDETLYKMVFQNGVDSIHYEDAAIEIGRRESLKSPKETSGEKKEVIYSWLQDDDEE